MHGVAPPCIIEVALNGATTRAINPHVPHTPAEITADALACVAAGASIVHNHDDEPMWVDDGVHAAAPYIEAWRPVLAEHHDVLFYATQASGGPGITIETRWAHHIELASLTRLALVDPGSVSLGGDRVYLNTHDDAAYGFDRCAELGLIPSVSIFDPSFLRAALDLGLPQRSIVKFYLGGPVMPFGLPPTEASLDAYLAMLDDHAPWLVAVLGGDVIESGLAELALARGGHLRVGLEDYAGPRTPRNVELVREAAALIERTGRRVATPAETRTLLDA